MAGPFLVNTTRLTFHFPLITVHIFGLASSIACAVLMVLCSRFACYNKNLTPDWLLSGWRWPVIGSARSSHFQHLTHTEHMWRWSLDRLLHIPYNIPGTLCSLGNIYNYYNYDKGWASALFQLTSSVQWEWWVGSTTCGQSGARPILWPCGNWLCLKQDLKQPGPFYYGPSYFNGPGQQLPPLQLFGVTVTATESDTDTVTDRILRGFHLKCFKVSVWSSHVTGCPWRPTTLLTGSTPGSPVKTIQTDFFLKKFSF